MSDLTLYGHIISPPCRSVLAFLKLSNIPFNYQHVDLLSGADQTEEYTRINPYQTIPTLVHGNFNLWESAAIIPYLSTTFNTNNQWYPKDSKLRARIDSYFHWHHQNIREPLALFVFRKVNGPKFFGLPELTEEEEAVLRDKFFEALRNIKWVLSSTGYIARSTGPTIADVFAADEVEYARGMFRIEEYPEVKKWFDQISDITEVRELLEQAREMYGKLG